jgi:hypothetical protein
VTTLLDANVLIALVVAEHVHHTPAEVWLAEQGGSFATCPITQGGVMRLLMRQGHDSDEAMAFLKEVTLDARHVFWADDLTYLDVSMHGVIGNRQVTDAYLAELARVNGGRLATFDQGLAGLHPDVAELVPAG